MFTHRRRILQIVDVALWLAACVFFAPLAALAQGPIAVAPAARSFWLGAFELIALRDTAFVTPNDGGDFGSNVGPAAVAEVLRQAGAPTDAISLDIDALAVKTPGRVVLFDTGLGPARHGVLMASLGLARIAPAEVSDIFITHSHLDHIGGLLTAAGASAFPKAVIWFSAKEWAWLRAQPRAKALVAAIAPQVKTFKPGRPVLPGVTPIALYGHTPGHVGYQITSRGRTLEDIGDIAHSTIISLAEPDWLAGIDQDPAMGAVTRRRELNRLAASHELIFAPHFPFPGIGRISPKGHGFVWRPAPGPRL
jgi:glyoxylase-like metal-dependent hydrolase (beta-lactamase superfamily II)